MDKTEIRSRTPQPDDKYLVPGLIRGLQVLQAFTPESREMTLSEIARRLGTTRSAAFRTVYTLAHQGYLLHDPQTARYTLGPAVLRLGYGYLATRELVEIALPELEKLRDATDWSAHLGVRDGRFVLYMLRVPSHMGLASIVHVGSRLPAAGTTMGRVLLADLGEDDLVRLYRDETYQNAPGQTPRSLTELLAQWRRDRRSDAVVQIGNFEMGIASIAAPVRDIEGTVVAAINLTRPATGDGRDGIEPGVRQAVLDAAAAITRLLGGLPERPAGA
ncbi:IclR family transcriptional regulator [Nitratireductor sp. ZSWI3]|uniref:IclR family transcriptional regulator n=1 Tax=Nitratireductor sp. ZSWI3 TaxID=2966359 RepID=UPI0021506180|nr:IclR family transcriptional regulator [Nitratireductor sp. ZSWI3]MCR4267754.1 IclR family transcriptional regulator [Nitratireductor sp. ZSWI3]